MGFAVRSERKIAWDCVLSIFGRGDAMAYAAHFEMLLLLQCSLWHLHRLPLAIISKFVQPAVRSWRRLNGHNQLANRERTNLVSAIFLPGKTDSYPLCLRRCRTTNSIREYRLQR